MIFFIQGMGGKIPLQWGVYIMTRSAQGKEIGRHILSLFTETTWTCTVQGQENRTRAVNPDREICSWII